MSELVDAHNEYRKRRGNREPLIEDANLSAAAQGHAEWMQRRQRMSHDQGRFGKNLAERVRDAGYQFSRIGENIAAGQQDVESVMQAWIHSRGHRNNILGNYQHIGVGRAGSYWCVVFGSPS